MHPISGGVGTVGWHPSLVSHRRSDGGQNDALVREPFGLRSIMASGGRVESACRLRREDTPDDNGRQVILCMRCTYSY